MTPQHTIRVIETLEAQGVVLANFTAEITVNLLSSGAAEFASVVQIDGPHIYSVALVTWAERWVSANQNEIRSDVRASVSF